MTFDGEVILTVLDRHGVRCVVIGGFAAVVHGSPLPTNDVDIAAPERAEDNLSRLSTALTELDARVRAEGSDPLPFAQAPESLAAAEMLKLITRYGDLDIIFVPAASRCPFTVGREVAWR